MSSRVPANLAPMEGVSEWPFRLWMAMFGGFEQATTPFIRVTDTYPHRPDVLNDLFVDRPHANYELVPQLMASSPERFIEVAAPLLEGFPFVEINCGCPSPKVFKHKAGSQILVDPRYFENFILKVSEAVGEKKLAVKIRLGVTSTYEAFELYKCLKDLPLTKLTVHGRTKVQGYRGSANWGLIAEAATTLPFPVVGSGDIECHHSFNRMTENSDVAAVIIGRGALKNPWVFKEIQNQTRCIKSKEHVKTVLKVFWQLHFAALNGMSPDIFAGRLGFNCNQDEWKSNLEVLTENLAAIEFNKTVARVAIGRLKMIWNYMRYQVCSDPLAAARCLRSANLCEFFERIETLDFIDSINDAKKPTNIVAATKLPPKSVAW